MIYASFDFLFKNHFYQKLFSYCWDKFAYPGSIVNLSCFPKNLLLTQIIFRPSIFLSNISYANIFLIKKCFPQIFFVIKNFFTEKVPIDWQNCQNKCSYLGSIVYSSFYPGYEHTLSNFKQTVLAIAIT